MFLISKGVSHKKYVFQGHMYLFLIIFDNRAVPEYMAVIWVLISTVSSIDREVTLIIGFRSRCNKVPYQIFTSKLPPFLRPGTLPLVPPYCCSFFLRYSYPSFLLSFRFNVLSWMCFRILKTLIYAWNNLLPIFELQYMLL